jgi:hypothetical protein
MTTSASTLAQATEAYQALREGQRRLEHDGDDHDLVEQVTEDVDKARAAMEVAWLNHIVG